MEGSDALDPTAGTPPAVTDPQPGDTPAAPTPPPPTSTGPWDAALAERFSDATQRQAVEEFLKETVQPYVTRIEQGTPEDEYARSLYKDFKDDPQKTFVDVAREIYGPENAKKIVAALKEEAEVTNPETSEELESIDLDELPQEARDAVEWAQQERRNQAWNAALKDIQEANPDLTIKEDLFRPFVIAAEGDTRIALEGYKTFVEEGVKEFVPSDESAEGKTATEGAATPEEGAETPPPTLPGAGGPAQGAELPAPESLDDAIDAVFSEMQSASQPPPTV